MSFLEPPSPRSKPWGSHYLDQTAILKAVGLFESPAVGEEPSSKAVWTESCILVLLTSPAPHSIPAFRHH